MYIQGELSDKNLKTWGKTINFSQIIDLNQQTSSKQTSSKQRKISLSDEKTDPVYEVKPIK